MVLSLVALFFYPLPLPQAVTLAIVAYFILVEGYAAIAFLRGMLATGGPTHWRMGFAAGGSGLLAVAIFLVGIASLVPDTSIDIVTLRRFLTILAGISYYLGFVPPGWLRRIWQLPELHRFLRAIAGASPAERSARAAQELSQAASRIVAGLGAVVALWDESQKQLRVEVSNVAALSSGSLSIAEGVTGQVWAEQQPAVVMEPGRLGRDEARIAAQLGARALLAVPIRSAQRAWGVLLVFQVRGPLFPEDELSLLALLGEQYALALDNADLVVEQRRLVDQLEAANERRQFILETTQEAFIAMDANGLIIDWNKEAEAIFGWPREEILGQSLAETIIPLQYRESHRRGLQRFLATGEGPMLNRRLELDALHRDGNEFPVELTITPMREGDSYTFNAFLHDITERKQAEEELRFQGEVMRNMPGGVVVIRTSDGMIIYANSRFEEMFGYGPGELAGKHISIVNAPGEKDPEEVAREIIAALKEEGAWRGEVLNIKKDGTTFWSSASVSTFEHHEYGKIWVSVQADITERKEMTQQLIERTEQLEAVNRELEFFAYSVSHDLRAPLRSIDGFSQALLEDYPDRLDSPGVDYLKRVRSASQSMGQLIDDLLKLSRLTRMEIQPQTVNLSAMARAVAESLKQTRPERQVNWVIADGLADWGDPVLLQSVLENLMGNAWKFTSGHPVATIEFGATWQDGKRVYFVRDDGAGFDMAYMDKLFGPFQRLHGRNEFEGSGIGLASVQRIIHGHRGKVWAEGAVEQGATFYFTLGQ
jgi:PAS domain S-box-containing protein